MNVCPVCNSHVVRIVYGYPTDETFQEADRGEVRLGGCVVTGPNMANSACTACDWVGRIDN